MPDETQQDLLRVGTAPFCTEWATEVNHVLPTLGRTFRRSPPRTTYSQTRMLQTCPITLASICLAIFVCVHHHYTTFAPSAVCLNFVFCTVYDVKNQSVLYHIINCKFYCPCNTTLYIMISPTVLISHVCVCVCVRERLAFFWVRSISWLFQVAGSCKLICRISSQ